MTEDGDKRVSVEQATLVADLERGAVCTKCRHRKGQETGHDYNVPYLTAKQRQGEAQEAERMKMREAESAREATPNGRVPAAKLRGLPPKVAKLVVSEEPIGQARMPGRPLPRSPRMQQLYDRRRAQTAHA